MLNKNRVKEILRILRRAYGAPPGRRRSDPIDEIVRTILSQNTNDTNSLRAFAVLKRKFKSWEGLLNTDTAKLARLIKYAGLANIKAERIKEALLEIKRREGRLSLGSLKNMGTGEAISYLKSLKGVGPKTAACVLLFSFGKPVMPVDTHIYRVAKRLGLIGPKVSIEEAHVFLTTMFYKELVPRRGLLRKPCSGSSPDSITAGFIYSFHLGIIEHGRKTCKAQNPRCGVCLLYSLCRFK
ncbi:MAG: endonuclease III [Candidatus Omnitrophica bacterium]|nr:endonuclease III [Candidatus Omnitrophota bacterium]